MDSSHTIIDFQHQSAAVLEFNAQGVFLQGIKKIPKIN